MKTLMDFQESIKLDTVPQYIDKPVFKALWLAAKKEWEQAHTLLRTCEDKDGGAWLHAYLHRLEGDTINANYWYKRAGIEPYSGDADTELEEITMLMIRSSNIE